MSKVAMPFLMVENITKHSCVLVLNNAPFFLKNQSVYPLGSLIGALIDVL
ncbi:hypothetical protein ES707_12821 [subsurface metagenome]